MAWISHILHGMSPRQCREILEKVAGAMEPGGRIVVHDFILEETRDRPVFPALFSLNMLLGTEGGRAYSEKEIGEMLSGCGATGVRRIPFTGPNDSGLMVGVIP
jgi:hypothetical protein